MSEEKNVTKNLDEGIKRFNALYLESTAKRKEACVIYAELSNGDPVADAAFRAQHPEWTSTQWKILFLVGTGVLYEEFLNLHIYSVSLYLSKLPIEQQKKIYHQGISCIFPNNQIKKIKIGQVQGELLRQLFFDDGHLRNVEEQKAYREELRRHKLAEIKNQSNWTVRGKALLVRRANVLLNAEDLKAVLLHRNRIFTADELREIADTIDKIKKSKKSTDKK